MSAGRVLRAGGMQTEPAGYSVRTEGNPPILRPGYVVSQGTIMPSGTGGAGPVGASTLLDLSTVSAWRLIAVAAAIAYIWGFHVSLGRVRVGVGG